MRDENLFLTCVSELVLETREVCNIYLLAIDMLRFYKPSCHS